MCRSSEHAKSATETRCSLLCFLLQKFLEVERGVESDPQPRVEVQGMSTRAYLDHTVVPILLDAMSAVVKERLAP